MQKQIRHTERFLKSHPTRCDRQNTLEFEINEISQHVDASHKQACSDLGTVSQLIVSALQNEVQRNMALRMLIHRLEERASENGRSLSEQVESNRQLKLQVDELQKHLEDKDNSLTQANQTIASLKNELKNLHQQLHSHQSNHRTIQEVTEWLKNGESQTSVVEEDGELDVAPVLSSEINQTRPDAESLVQLTMMSVQLADCSTTQGQQGPEGKNEDGEKAKTVPDSRLAPETLTKTSAADDNNDDDDAAVAPETMADQSAAAADDDAAAVAPEMLLLQDEETQTNVVKTEAILLDIPVSGTDADAAAAIAPETLADQSVPVQRVSSKAHLTRPQHASTRKRPQHSVSPVKDVSEEEDRRRKKERRYDCTQCEESFLSKGALGLHRRMHARDRPHQCELCGKMFLKKFSLSAHLLSHTGEKQHACSHCGKRFGQPSDLRRHERGHSGVKPHQCAQCGQRFTQAFSLKNHAAIHALDRPRLLCSLCGRSFTQQKSLKRHQLVHCKGAR